MLRSYLTTALRHLWRERGYAAINLFGLAVGLALCLLVIQLAAYQLSVGDFHDKKDRVYRILKEAGGNNTPRPLGSALKEQVPEVEETVRLVSDHRGLFRVGEESAIQEKALWTESSVFEMFSLPLLRGDAKTALSRPYTMVLTEPLARRLFGESDPMGQVIRYNQDFDCIVTGIVGRPPPTSLLQFSALLSLATVDKEGHPVLADVARLGPRGATIMPWSSLYETFVQLHFSADAATVAKRIPGIVKDAGGLHEDTDSYALQPLKSIYFDTEIGTSIGPKGNPMHLALYVTLAMVLLTVAGFNYVNLATARAQGRLQETGIRKALGAHRGQLVRQLLCESVLLSLGATVLGVAMAETVTPFLPAIGRVDLEWASSWTLSTCAGAAVLATAVGLAAGAYPAWVVACFQPAVLEREGRIGGARLRQGLILAQFTVTATLLTMTLLIWHQVSFIQSMFRENSVLGLEPEQVVIIDNRHREALTADQARAFKAELLQDSRIAAVILSTSVPGQGYSRRSTSGEGKRELPSYYSYRVDGDFAGIMGLRMVQGRPLTDEPADAKAVVINETAVRRWELEQPLGRTIPHVRIRGRESDRRVVGVIEDFHFQGPGNKIEPLVMRQIDRYVGAIIVRVRPGHLEEALQVIDDKWMAAVPYLPIRRESLEEVVARFHSAELKIGRALTLLLSLTIAVALVGLFGLAAHAAQARTREVGIRKVFGASPGRITAMLLGDFAKPVAIAFLLSVPVAYGLAGHWLQDYVYRVEVGVALFMVSGALCFLIAGLTVGGQDACREAT